MSKSDAPTVTCQTKSAFYSACYTDKIMSFFTCSYWKLIIHINQHHVWVGDKDDDTSYNFVL